MLSSTFQVVVTEKLENTIKILEGSLMRFQECLLGSVRVGPVISSAAGHRTHLEYLAIDPFATQNGVGFIPVALRFHAPVVALPYGQQATFMQRLTVA